jgi:hypothetical protein
MAERTRAADRLDDLLASRAIEGLGEQEQRELEALLAAHPEVDADSYDRAAAAVHLALLGEVGAGREMPGALRERLAQSAARVSSSLQPRR